MKKLIKIIVINLICLFFAFILLEFCIYKFIAVKQYQTVTNKALKYNIKMDSFFENYERDCIKYRDTSGAIRLPSGLEYKNKKPIVLFGCSFTYGNGLEYNQTLSYKLATYNKRPVYNRGIPGGGIQHALYQLETDDLYNLIKNPEYVFFLYNPAIHTHRLYEYTFMIYDEFLYLRYKDKNGKLKICKELPKYINGLYTIREFYKIINQKKLQDYQKTTDFTLLHFKEIRNKIKENWKNAKFIILVYPNNEDNFKQYNMIMDELRKNDFEVIEIENLTKENLKERKYKVSDTDSHPNKEVWELIVPILSKKLRLYK